MITETDLTRMLDQTRELRRGFATTAPTSWGPTTAAAELAIQLGHVACCIARRHNIDVAAFSDPQRPIDDLGDELADVTMATLSVAVLADTVPPAPQPRPRVAAGEIEALLRLVIAAGRTAEAAMIASGHRHYPAGRPPQVAESCATTLGIADSLADTAGFRLLECFESMAVDASRFLAERASQICQEQAIADDPPAAAGSVAGARP
jgi:hypothetical protein